MHRHDDDDIKFNPKFPPHHKRPPFFDEIDPKAVSIFEEIRSLHKLQMAAFSSLLRRHGLSRSQGFCIKALEHREGLSQSDLAELMGISRSTTTVMLQKMESAGLIARRNDPDDARVARVFLTKKGRDANTGAEKDFSELFRRAFSLSPETYAACLSGLQQITAVFKDAAEENKSE